MPFKKKKKQKEIKKKEPYLSLGIKLKILAIFFWLLSLVLFLSFFNKGGIGGKYLLKFFVFLFGKTTLTLPFVFLLLGAILFRGQEKAHLKVSFLSLALILIGILGIIGVQSSDLKGAGLLGYLVSFPIYSLFGFWVAIIIFGGLLLSSFLISKELTLIPIKKALEEKKEKEIEKLKKIESVEDLKKVEPKIKIPILKPSKNKEEKAKIQTSKDKKKRLISLTKKERSFKKTVITYPLELLAESKKKPLAEDIEKRKIIIQNTLGNFGIEVEMREVYVGPTVTQYTLKPLQAVKLSKITSLANNLALALAAHPIRIEAPIPGKPLIGVEVPNKERGEVRLRELLSLEEFRKSRDPLLFALGKDVAGKPLFEDLEKMPHLLVAGATGSGKTIFLNSLILSLINKNTPETLRFVIVDPKRVELSMYRNIPYLIHKVITDVNKVSIVLDWLIKEMEKRFRVLSLVSARNIRSYNLKAKETLPYIILIIDELADIMSAKGKEVEAKIVRLAQMARAVGIHLVLATQRPSVDVITGLIKANITSRIAFKVATQVDSRTILDSAGAERLLGKGDALFISPTSVSPKRVQTPFVSETEVQKIVDYLTTQEKLWLEGDELSNSLQQALISSETEGVISNPEEDELYEEAKKIVIKARKASASLLQRHLKIGYARAARLLDMLEKEGIVGPQEGSKPRKVYLDKVKDTDIDRLF